VRNVLLDIIKAFPQNDLGSAEVIDKTIEEIEAKIGEVISIEECALKMSCCSRFEIACISRLFSMIQCIS
jgi:hypothetical protein